MTVAHDVERSTTKLLYVPARILTIDVPHALREAAHYVLHATFCGRAIRRARSSWVPLNAAVLQSVSYPTLRAKRWLVEHGLLETNGSYQVGVTSTGYRWSDAYESAQRVPTTRAITRAILRSQRQRDATLSIGARHLIGRLRHFHIDAAAAYQTVQSLSPSKESEWSTQDYRSFLQTSIRLLADRDVYHVVDAYGRLHTPITSLHRQLRRHLRAYDAISGSPLINLDIRNSQPLCMGLLLAQGRMHPRPGATDNQAISVNTSNPLQQDSQATTPPPHPTDSQSDHEQDEEVPYVSRNAGNRYPLAAGVDARDESAWLHDHRAHELGSDVADYLRTCEAGRFYEVLMRFFPALRDADAFMSADERDELRGRFKAQVFREILFGPTRETELTQTFRDLWPAVWDRIVDEKGGAEGYPALARAMQRSESALMIGRVGGRLAEELPQVPVATIHDSVLVPPEHVDRVRAIVIDEWARAGLRPSISAKAA